MSTVCFVDNDGNPISPLTGARLDAPTVPSQMPDNHAAAEETGGDIHTEVPPIPIDSSPEQSNLTPTVIATPADEEEQVDIVHNQSDVSTLGVVSPPMIHGPGSNPNPEATVTVEPTHSSNLSTTQVPILEPEENTQSENSDREEELSMDDEDEPDGGRAMRLKRVRSRNSDPMIPKRIKIGLPQPSAPNNSSVQVDAGAASGSIASPSSQENRSSGSPNHDQLTNALNSLAQQSPQLPSVLSSVGTTGVSTTLTSVSITATTTSAATTTSTASTSMPSSTTPSHAASTGPIVSQTPDHKKVYDHVVGIRRLCDLRRLSILRNTVTTRESDISRALDCVRRKLWSEGRSALERQCEMSVLKVTETVCEAERVVHQFHSQIHNSMVAPETLEYLKSSRLSINSSMDKWHSCIVELDRNDPKLHPLHNASVSGDEHDVVLEKMVASIEEPIAAKAWKIILSKMAKLSCLEELSSDVSRTRMILHASTDGVTPEKLQKIHERLDKCDQEIAEYTNLLTEFNPQQAVNKRIDFLQKYTHLSEALQTYDKTSLNIEVHRTVLDELLEVQSIYQNMMQLVPATILPHYACFARHESDYEIIHFHIEKATSAIASLEDLRRDRQEETTLTTACKATQDAIRETEKELSEVVSNVDVKWDRIAEAVNDVKPRVYRLLEQLKIKRQDIYRISNPNSSLYVKTVQMIVQLYGTLIMLDNVATLEKSFENFSPEDRTLRQIRCYLSNRSITIGIVPLEASCEVLSAFLERANFEQILSSMSYSFDGCPSVSLFTALLIYYREFESYSKEGCFQILSELHSMRVNHGEIHRAYQRSALAELLNPMILSGQTLPRRAIVEKFFERQL